MLGGMPRPRGQVPIGRLGEPDDVAAVVAFLLLRPRGVHHGRDPRRQRRLADRLSSMRADGAAGVRRAAGAGREARAGARPRRGPRARAGVRRVRLRLFLQKGGFARPAADRAGARGEPAWSTRSAPASRAGGPASRPPSTTSDAAGRPLGRAGRAEPQPGRGAHGRRRRRRVRRVRAAPGRRPDPRAGAARPGRRWRCSPTPSPRRCTRSSGWRACSRARPSPCSASAASARTASSSRASLGARVSRWRARSAEQRARASLGADEVVAAGDGRRRRVRALTEGGAGPDVVLQCVGAAAPDEQALAMAAPGGRVVFVGATPEPDAAALDRGALARACAARLARLRSRRHR